MLGALKYGLKLALLPLLYVGGIIMMFYTMLKEAKWGLFLLIFLIPQPNIWYKFHQYPFGKDFLDLLFFAILVGMLIQKKGFDKSINSSLIIGYIMISYFALWHGSMRFSLPMPITTSNSLLFDWKNYAQMIFLYFLSFNILKNEEDQKNVIILIAIVVLFIAIRSYRNFSAGDVFRYDSRAGGPFEAVGLGANHFGAFIAHSCSVFLGLFLFDKNKKRKYLFLTTVLFGLHPLFFSYSRGAYLAFFGAMTIFGLIKKRSLLVVAAIILIAWQSILPPSVVDRITGTKTEEGEIESSAAHRLILWDHAMNLFEQNPVFGVGFGGFGLTVPAGEHLTDTHNFYLKTLAEQGIIGGIFFLSILFKSFLSGWRLLKIGNSPLQQGLGFGFMGCVIACAITNMFGDRWSYFALGGYYWILWGLVDRINKQIPQARLQDHLAVGNA